MLKSLGNFWQLTRPVKHWQGVFMKAGFKSGPWVRAGLAVVLALSVAGCTRIFDPYVATSKETKASRPDNPKQNLNSAKKYATYIKQKLEFARRDHAYLQSGLGFSLIPLGAAAAFLGLNSTSDASREAISAMGVTGAGLLVVDGTLGPGTRINVYMAGIRGIDCALGQVATLPNDIPDFKVNIKTILTNIDLLRSFLADYDSLMTAQTRAVYDRNAPSTLANWEKAVTAARSDVTNGAMVVKEGLALAGASATASAPLVDAINNIVGLVNAELGKSAINLRTLAQQVANMQPIFRAPAQGAPSSTEGTGDTNGAALTGALPLDDSQAPDKTEITQAINEIALATRAMAEPWATVSAQVNAARDRTQVDFTSCFAGIP
ncbi:MAG: hypothetical protein JKY68_06635, partial [Rhodospirillales bacterium]|nr:hypothetical protein [Rhodospirillales bacterium]